MKANLLGKQRQLAQNKELTTSFKNTSNLAHALTKERVQIQNDLQKISAGKYHCHCYLVSTTIALFN